MSPNSNAYNMTTECPQQDDPSPSNISLGDISVKADTIPSLQKQYYKITPEQADFFKAQTGITSDEELKQHIIAVQEAAYKVG